jgi:outer membrane protein TolC
MTKINLKFLYIVFACFFVMIKANAQDLLTVEDAVAIALDNNYQILIASNNLKIDETGVSLGFAGMLPTVNGTVSDNRSLIDLEQVRNDGSQVSQDNAKNNTFNYGARLDWTIFDGFGMFARYDQLKEIEKLGEAELQQAIVDRVSQVMITYYDLVQQQQQLTALDSTMVISQQRVELSNNRFTIGKASKLEVLNAQVDLNTDQTLQMRQKELYANTKILLNELLARDSKTDFKVVDAILVDNGLELSQLESLAMQLNPQLQAQLINKRIAELQLKQVKASRLPVLGVNAGYSRSESESSLGFAVSSASQGWNYGFTASINIFDGFNQNRNEKIAKIQIENSQIAIKQQEQQLTTQLATAYQTYLTNISLVELESGNVAIAKENLDITMDKYRIGTIPTIEFRTAQLNYINAEVRYSNAMFQAKLSEITLKQLAGSLTL